MAGRKDKHGFRTAKRREVKLALFNILCVYVWLLPELCENPTQLLKMLTHFWSSSSLQCLRSWLHTALRVHCHRPSENTRGNSFFKSEINFFVFSDFSFITTSTFLKNEFTGNFHKSKSAIQSISNKFNVPGRTLTFDLKVLSINDTFQLNSPLKFWFSPNTLLTIFNTPQWWTTNFFHVCSFTIEMSLPVSNNNFSVCSFVFAFTYFVFHHFQFRSWIKHLLLF